MRKTLTSLCALGAALGLSLALAATASAGVKPQASFGCNNNLGGFCGSQEFAAPADQVWNVFHGGQGARGQKVTEWTRSDSQNTDFYARNFNGLSGSGGMDKTFQYSPGGIKSGWCLSFPSVAMNSGAVLRRCNESIWQTFKPVYVNGVDVAWKNLASGFVVTDPGYAVDGGAQLTQTVWQGSQNQEEQFVS